MATTAAPPPTAPSVEDRIQAFNQITTALQRAKQTARESNQISTYFSIKKRIGRRSRFAETHIASLRNLPAVQVALKVMPVTTHPRDDQFDWSIGEVVKEIRILDALCLLVQRHVTPNVPLSFDTLICFNCRYTNPVLLKKDAPKTCVIIPNELADTDLLGWMNSGQAHTPTEWKSCIFQVLAGLCASQEHLGLIHGDLHDGNMLVTNVPPGGYWHYRFVDRTDGNVAHDFYVPNTGQLWKLWDFGQSKIHAKPTRENRKRMWDDIDRAIGDFMMGHFYKTNSSSSYTPLNLSSADHQRLNQALAQSRKGSRGSPAFALLYQLDWFRTMPKDGKILNAEAPYTVTACKNFSETSTRNKRKYAK